MRRALIVGIDQYSDGVNLKACVKDATMLATILERHGDGSPNFGVNLLTCPPENISRAFLRPHIEKLFAGNPELVLFYFAGHGAVTGSGECIVTHDAARYDEGIPLNEILEQSNRSNARNKVIILDCCHAGAMGDYSGSSCTHLVEGTTILAGCQKKESASEYVEGGVFTSLLLDGLQGGAADLCGEISPGGLYAYIDRSLGPWSQRPVFKTNVSRFTSLRKVTPPIEQELLRRIPEFFAIPSNEFPLSPEFEFSEANHDPVKVQQFKCLQQYERVGLVSPVDEEHMYYAAMNNGACKLTALGMHYWRLAKEGML